MKHLTIKIIVFCAMLVGIGSFAPPETAIATPVQVSVGVGINVPVHGYYRHHRRHHWHHHR